MNCPLVCVYKHIHKKNVGCFNEKKKMYYFDGRNSTLSVSILGTVCFSSEITSPAV